MAIDKRVWVWTEPDEAVQHLSPPPDSDVARVWSGTTLCGEQGELRWVSPENVDIARSCPRCVEAEGSHAPPLQGEYLGPV